MDRMTDERDKGLPSNLGELYQDFVNRNGAAIEWWEERLEQVGAFRYLTKTIRQFLWASKKADGPLDGHWARRAGRAIRSLFEEPEERRNVAAFVAFTTYWEQQGALHEEATAQGIDLENLSREEIDRRLNRAWQSERISKAFEESLTRYAQTIALQIAEREGSSDALRRLFDRISELAKDEPPPTALLPAPLTETTRLTIFSDPHSQAAIRSMWAIGNGSLHLWKNPPKRPPYYHDPDSNVLVYMGGALGSAAPTIKPAEAQQAWGQVLALDDRTVSTFIICIGKWFADIGGAGTPIVSTRIRATDILEFRGVKKHHKGGYRRDQKQETREDILTLNSIWVRSEQDIYESHGSRKRKKTVAVDSRLLEVAIESEPDLFGDETPYAFRIRPGDWAEHYLDEHNRMTALLLRPIMKYDPRQGVGRLAMRLGIYLTMQWRIRASYNNYNQPWLVRTLLEGACVPIEADARLYARFRGQVEEALDRLQDDKVLRWHYIDCDDSQLPKRGWFPVWLKWKVWIEPPATIPDQYKQMASRRARAIAAAKAATKPRMSPTDPPAADSPHQV